VPHRYAPVAVEHDQRGQVDRATVVVVEIPVAGVVRVAEVLAEDRQVRQVHRGKGQAKHLHGDGVRGAQNACTE
jgi:hypothetical protein